MTPIHQSEAPASSCRNTGRYGKMAPPPAQTTKSAAATTNSCRRPSGTAQSPPRRRRPARGRRRAGRGRRRRAPLGVVDVGGVLGHGRGSRSTREVPGRRGCGTPAIVVRRAEARPGGAAARRCPQEDVDGGALAPASALGLVHLRVGAGEQLVDAAQLEVVGHHRAETDGEVVLLAQLLALGLHRLLEAQPAIACRSSARRGGGRAWPAPRTRRRRAAPRRPARGTRRGARRPRPPAACRPPRDPLVVDALEAVHVEVREEHLPVAALGLAPDLVDLDEEPAAVEQAGELVDVGEAAQELLQLLVRGDAVADGEAEAAPADVHDARRDLHRHALPVAGDLHGLVGQRAGVREGLRALPHLAARLRRQHVLGGHREQLRAGVAQCQAGGLVDLHDLAGAAVLVEPVHQDDVAAGVEEGPVAALALKLLLVRGVQ